MKRPMLAVAATIVSLMPLAACSSSGGAAAPSTTSSTPTSSDSGNGSIAPAVSVPLDATAFAAAACTSLTEAQTEDLGISPRGEQAKPYECTWPFGPNLEWAVQLFYGNVEGGLQNDYNKHATGAYDNGGYFEPTTIAGYPGVFSNLSDFRARGTCDLNVATGGDTLFHVTVTGPANKDNCKAASTVASNVIATIKAGGQ